MNLTAMIFFHCVRMYERIGGNLGSNFVQYLICTYDFFRNLNIFLNQLFTKMYEIHKKEILIQLLEAVFQWLFQCTHDFFRYLLIIIK